MSEILEGRPPTDEEKQLAALFRDLEIRQLEFLDAAGKRIIELTTALLGVLFAIVAMGDTFPPAYLVNNTLAQVLTILTLVCYLGGMIFALRTVQPRDYSVHRYDLEDMRRTLRTISQHKTASLRWAGRLFLGGCLLLAGLVAWLVIRG